MLERMDLFMPLNPLSGLELLPLDWLPCDRLTRPIFGTASARRGKISPRTRTTARWRHITATTSISPG